MVGWLVGGCNVGYGKSKNIHIICVVRNKNTIFGPRIRDHVIRYGYCCRGLSLRQDILRASLAATKTTVSSAVVVPLLLLVLSLLLLLLLLWCGAAVFL